jgi:hypothetical protein
MTKLCRHCGEIKPREAFTIHTNTKDGLQPWCNDCKNERRRWARKNKVGFYATERERYHDQHNLTCRKLYWKYRNKVFEHYGARCNKCGFTDPRALSIDHVNGDGAEHRRRLNGVNLCKAVVRENYPKSYQILCMNCQMIKKYIEMKFEEV